MESYRIWVFAVLRYMRSRVHLEPIDFFLFPGDDAVGVKWLDLDSSLQLYASHIDFLHKTADHLKASW